MAVAPDCANNRLLAALPPVELQRWRPQLEPVELPLGQVLYEPGRVLSHVYFPTTAIVSLLYVLENGGSAEIAVVRNEGVVGISLFMDGASTPSRAVVQSAGEGLRLNARAIKTGVRASGPCNAPPVALHAGADHAIWRIWSYAPASLARPAVVPLACC